MTKTSFQTILDETRELSRKSNYANLAHALLHVEQSIIELADLRARIVLEGTKEYPDDKVVKDLYNQSRK
jgi:hypothetical protein